jgi:hypothetical protein
MAKWDGIEADNTPEPKGLAANYNFQRVKYWAGKVITFPIGERWLAISLTAVIGGALFTFTAMPVFVIISMAWVYRVRISKTLVMAKTRIKSEVIARQLDFGFRNNTLFTRFDWLEPSLLRALELGVLIALFAFNGELEGNLGIASFIVLFSIAFHHYDNLYRSMQNEGKPSWLSILGLSSPGRIILLVVATLLGLDLTMFAVYFSVLFLLASSIQWVSQHSKTKKY